MAAWRGAPFPHGARRRARGLGDEDPGPHHAVVRLHSLTLLLACGLPWLPTPGSRAGLPPTARQDSARPAAESSWERPENPWERPEAWRVREDLREALPPTIVVRELSSSEPPLQAWLVTARPDEGWEVEAALPKKGLRTTSAQAQDLGALVAVNAGFFSGTGSVSTVVDEGVLACCGPSAVTRQGGAYPVTRAAIGFDADGAIDCAWTWCFGDTLYAFEAPVPNAPGAPAKAPAREQGTPWRAEELVGGGPMLVSRSVLANREVAECFQSLGGTSRHPRTAAGWTKDGTLLLLVVDGRSKASRGATLAETGRMLLAHGAHEALNLDGGGSSTLWVAGRILNSPSDRSGERPVGSVLALVPAKRAPQ